MQAVSGATLPDKTGDGMGAAPDAAAHLRHQLRTPLNHIIGYSELLIDEVTEEGHDSLLPD